MRTALVTYLIFGIISGAAWIKMIVEVNNLGIVPHISLWRRSLRQFGACSVHREYLPGSSLRTLLVTTMLISAFFFGLFVFEAERTRPEPTNVQVLEMQRSRH